MSRCRVILYTVITGGYDSLPDIKPERGVDYWLFTDDLKIQTPSFWNKSLLANPLDLTPRRLSRLPKLRPHFYLPLHDISIYMDANLVLRKPIREFALSSVRELSIAVHPHPTTTCLYAEGKKCIRIGLDDERIILKQLERYQREGFPTNFGLVENSSIIRRNVEEVNRFNDLWHLEYYAGSQRDQVSFMYCVWRSGLPLYMIWQNPRENSIFSKRRHFLRDRNQKGGVEINSSKDGERVSGLETLVKRLPDLAEILLINVQTEAIINVFASSDKVKRIWCVDHNFDETAEGKRLLGNVLKCYPDIINKESFKTDAKQFNNQSLDLVYIDAPRDYKRTKRHIERWRPKVKAGGFIGGIHYSNKFQCVVQAIFECLGNPDWAFADSSWLFNVPKHTFGIVSYCSLSYLDAFEFSIDSWLKNGKANEVVIYTDSPEFARRAKPRERVRFVHAFATPVEKLVKYPWQRKIEAIQMYYETTLHPYFVYLDCDCWVQQEFKEVFSSMSETQIVGTRLLGRDNRGKGEANAGVVFFRHHPTLDHFFKLWNERAQHYEKANHVNYEQDSLSRLVIEAFDGKHPFRASLISERIYNCEHDIDDLWLQDIKQYQPKIVHFKQKRFRNKDLKQAVFALLDVQSTYVEKATIIQTGKSF
jgi:hypothetical protein